MKRPPSLSAALASAPYRARAAMADRLRTMDEAAARRGQARERLAAELRLGRGMAAVAAGEIRV